MRTLIIDRVENGYAICEENKEFFGITVDEVPSGAKEGDVLEIRDDGTLLINKEKTAQRRDKIKGKTSKLFK